LSIDCNSQSLAQRDWAWTTYFKNSLHVWYCQERRHEGRDSPCERMETHLALPQGKNFSRETWCMSESRAIQSTQSATLSLRVNAHVTLWIFWVETFLSVKYMEFHQRNQPIFLFETIPWFFNFLPILTMLCTDRKKGGPEPDPRKFFYNWYSFSCVNWHLWSDLGIGCSGHGGRHWLQMLALPVAKLIIQIHKQAWEVRKTHQFNCWFPCS
jgi:hypothetical protein